MHTRGKSDSRERIVHPEGLAPADPSCVQVVSNGAAASAAYDGPYYREEGEKLVKAGDLAFEARGIPVTAPKQSR